MNRNISDILVSILTHGSIALTGKVMFTDKGYKVIKNIRPYKYKACVVYFEDGTDQLRDYDESFYIQSPAR